MVNDSDDANGWLEDKVFEVGRAFAEVKRFDSYRPRYSMRVGWRNKDHIRTWFVFAPEHEQTYYDDICEAVAQAERYIIDETERRLKTIADDLQMQRERSIAKRKRHEQNVERRREENRQRTTRSKNGEH